ncbi:hypothetical protein [Phreatobacter sp.]|uniref:hypothetical protein n=1 Tax=Phreatobacter sp. TaxID=1966341 RepID=UPI003F720591
MSDLPGAVSPLARIVTARPHAGRVVVTAVGRDAVAELSLSPRVTAQLIAHLADALAGLAAPESPLRDDW